jgi:hypothetical protein
MFATRSFVRTGLTASRNFKFACLSSSSTERLIGQCKFFDDVKGFGFITHKDEDHFVHFSSIKSDGYKGLVG